MTSKMILHVDYWDKRKRTIQRISFAIKELDDSKPIVKSLRSGGLKIKQISIHIPFEQEKKS